MHALVILSWVLWVNPIPIQFSAESLVQHSNSGYLQLEWSGSDPDQNFILQQSNDSTFKDARTIYQGPDQASFVSGLDNGTYYFRVGDESSNWSESLVLHVQHQSLPLALTLSGIGFLVFACTVFIVIKGVRTSTS